MNLAKCMSRFVVKSYCILGWRYYEISEQNTWEFGGIDPPVVLYVGKENSDRINICIFWLEILFEIAL